MRKVLVVVAMAALCIGAGTACDPVVRCGAVITKDTRLGADVTGCHGTAIIIGADGVTLDLAGHSVTSSDGIGLRSDGHDDLTVTNGAIRGFTTGMRVTDAHDLRLTSVAITGGDYPENGDNIRDRVGLYLERVQRARLARSSSAGYFGVVMLTSDWNRFDHFRSEGDVDNNTQLYLADSDHNTFTDSAFSSAGGDNVILGRSHHNTFIRDHLSNSNAVSVTVSRSNHTTFRANTIASESSGLTIYESTGTVVDSNTGQTNPGDSINVIASTATVLRGNRVGLITVTGSSKTIVRDNIVRPIFDPRGIFVAADSTGTELRDNDVANFELDGIAVEASGTILQGNRSDDNGQLGIDAVAGVIDGGGNRASGNGDPAQCLNIICG